MAARPRLPLKVRGVALEKFLAARYPDVLSRLRYIKVNVEDYDLNVLQSIRSVLAERRPHVRAEVYKWLSTERRREMFRFLSDLGYSVRSMDKAWRRGPPLAEPEMHRQKTFDIYAEPH